jgi:hypothetical protein
LLARWEGIILPNVLEEMITRVTQTAKFFNMTVFERVPQREADVLVRSPERESLFSRLAQRRCANGTFHR